MGPVSVNKEVRNYYFVVGKNIKAFTVDTPELGVMYYN